MIAAHKGNVAEYYRTLANVWNQDRRQSFAELLETHYRLSDDEGIAAQNYNLKDNPYWRDVIDVCHNGRTTRVTIMKSTQVGGTITTQGIFIASALIDPSPGMMVFPDKTEGITQRNRIFANMLESSDQIAELVPPKHRWNDRAIDMQTQIIHLGYATVPQSMRGKPCRRVSKHEVDIYTTKDSNTAGDPKTVPDERTKNVPGSLVLEESTPVGSDSYIAGQFDESQKRFWFGQCPKCKRYQKVRFFPYREGKYKGRGGVVGYKNAAGNLLSPDEARKKAYYLCIHGCKIEQQYKNTFIKNGKWVAAGCSIDDETGEITGKPYVSDRHVGFHIWTMMQSRKSIGEIAEKYVVSKNSGQLRSFYQDWLGQKFESKLNRPTWEKLGEQNKAGHQLGEVPNDCWFLTLGADVQQDEVFWVVWGWSPGRTPSLIDLGIFRQDEFDTPFVLLDQQAIAADLAQLADQVNRNITSWPVISHDGNPANPLGLQSLSLRMSGVDTNYRMHQVHDLTRLLRDDLDPRKDVLRSTRGDNKIDRNTRWRMTTVERSQRDNKPYPGGLRLWGICKDFYRDIWDSRLISNNSDLMSMRLPVDLQDSPHGERFLRQMLNEKTETKFDKQNFKKDVRKISNRQLRCDFRDASIIAEAMADMVVELTFGRLEWHPTEWAAYLEQRKRNQERAAEVAEMRRSGQTHPQHSNDIIAR